MLRPFPFSCLALGFALFLTTMAPRDVAAQTPPGAPREGLGVAVVLTTQVFTGPVLSVRVTKPVHEKVAFDFDVGWTLRRVRSRLGPPGAGAKGADRVPATGRWRASGLVGGARMRWLPAGRSETGWSGAMSFGASIMHSGIYNTEERLTRAWVFVPDFLNVTLDKLSENGFRIGGSVGGVTSVPFALGRAATRKRIGEAYEAQSNLPMFYASLFGAWTQ